MAIENFVHSDLWIWSLPVIDVSPEMIKIREMLKIGRPIHQVSAQTNSFLVNFSHGILDPKLHFHQNFPIKTLHKIIHVRITNHEKIIKSALDQFPANQLAAQANSWWARLHHVGRRLDPDVITGFWPTDLREILDQKLKMGFSPIFSFYNKIFASVFEWKSNYHKF